MRRHQTYEDYVVFLVIVQFPDEQRRDVRRRERILLASICTESSICRLEMRRWKLGFLL